MVFLCYVTLLLLHVVILCGIKKDMFIITLIILYDYMPFVCNDDNKHCVHANLYIETCKQRENIRT